MSEGVAAMFPQVQPFRHEEWYKSVTVKFTRETFAKFGILGPPYATQPGAR